ncbi:ATP phosphoribosyltransferase [Candidatus Kaiserbacteria bacterium]|nr:ATP phosphoribosyltransferase [Candidatus Kaiserbacteria bacterium]
MSLKIALPSKDLEEPTVELLKATRIKIHHSKPRNSHVKISGLRGIQRGAFMRSADVAEFVGAGAYDVGITTNEVIAEYGRKVVVCANLGFSRNGRQTKVVLFAHQRSGIRGLKDIPRGTTVRTEFPRLTRAFFRRYKVLGKVVLVPSRGSTETHVPCTYPLGVCLTDSGQTIKDHGLRVIAELMRSDTVLIANRNAYRDPEKKMIIEDLASLLVGTVNAREMRVLKFNMPITALPRVRKILPGRKGQSPTINHLDDGNVAVEYVVLVPEINDLKPRLKRAGATYILVGREESVIP